MAEDDAADAGSEQGPEAKAAPGKSRRVRKPDAAPVTAPVTAQAPPPLPLAQKESAPAAEPKREPVPASASAPAVPQASPADAPPPPAPPSPYRVLARKYRPRRFEDLIGQEVMVRTLANAFAQGRIAHAFMLTGVRGVGKTTTARIIARALNCIGPDGQGGPTISPCGVCPNCIAIAEDRHVDVIEMDAASRTGVNDIRELIEGVRYLPVQARTKVYIVDEVHMLSTQAFNALLKTLEEPPPHVKFVFATTEIRRVPVTVLSRCQRFDLRRVEERVLIAHFRKVCAAEGVDAEDEALALIARAADGSVRDGLSLLDQGIALIAAGGGHESGGRIETEPVRGMLGMADRARSFDLAAALFAGKVAEALDILAGLHAGGADPALVVQDLLEIVHFLTRARAVPGLLDDPTVPELERSRGRGLAEALSVPVLARAWQVLLRGLSEVQMAPRPLAAAEMLMVRFCHLADMPDPAKALRLLAEGRSLGPMASAPASGGAPAATLPGPTTGGRHDPVESGIGAGTTTSGGARFALVAGGGGGRSIASGRLNPDAVTGAVTGTEAAVDARADLNKVPRPALAPPPPAKPAAAASADRSADGTMPQTLVDMARLAKAHRDMQLFGEIIAFIHLVRCSPGLLEIRLARGAESSLPGRLKARLKEWTGRDWSVAVTSEPGEPTLRQQQEAREKRLREAVLAVPLVARVRAVFPRAKLILPPIPPIWADPKPSGETAATTGSDPPGDDREADALGAATFPGAERDNAFDDAGDDGLLYDDVEAFDPDA